MDKVDAVGAPPLTAPVLRGLNRRQRQMGPHPQLGLLYSTYRVFKMALGFLFVFSLIALLLILSGTLKLEIAPATQFNVKGGLKEALKVATDSALDFREEMAGHVVKKLEGRAKRCEALGFTVDYDYKQLAEEVGQEWQCTSNDLADTAVQLVGAGVKTWMALPEFAQLALKSQQKRFVIQNFLKPFCLNLAHLLSDDYHCFKDYSQKYPTLTRILRCDKDKAQFFSDFKELEQLLGKDLCRDDASWLFDYVDGVLDQCADQVVAVVVESNTFSARWKGFWEELTDQDAANGSHEEFCHLTETFGHLVSNLLVEPCAEGAGKILLDAFKDTRSFWNGKCNNATTDAKTEPGPSSVQDCATSDSANEKGKEVCVPASGSP